MGLLRFFQTNEMRREDQEEESLSTITTITATKGQYEGSIIEFDGSVVIGRDPACAELIIDDSNVSRMHCTITFEPKDHTYIVTDHSTNGTFIGRERLEKGKSRIVPKGTFIIIGQSGNNFRLD
ncbi:MAG: FHA domain-containing protein [Lachnospiraceae bacterium]|nr:FHA domain-containing protein [Lachnospiraceae bacterium]